MKKTAFFLTSIVILTAFTTVIPTWKSDKPHSQLGFTITHLGIADVSGTFNDFDVMITSSKDDFSDAVFELTANVGSIDTRVEQRNDHLKSSDFFDVEKYPTMKFKSSSIEKYEDNKYKLTGDLTIRAITKQVTMDLVYRGTIDNQKVPTAGFQLTGTIKRSDFNVGPGFPEPMLSDEVRIKADGEFTKNK